MDAPEMRHASVVFLQSADDFDDFVDPETGETGDRAFFGASKSNQIAFLAQWDHDDFFWETGLYAGYGTSDNVYRHVIDPHYCYVLSVNRALGYAGLAIEADQ